MTMKAKTIIQLSILSLVFTSRGYGEAINPTALHQEVSRIEQDFYHSPRTNALARFSAFYDAHPWSTIPADEVIYYASFIYDYARLLMDLRMYEQSILVLDEIPTNTLSPSTRKELLFTKSMALRGKARQSSSPERERLWEKALAVNREAEVITNEVNPELGIGTTEHP